MALAYDTHPRLKAERASLRATDQEVAKATSGWRPSLNASGEWGWQKKAQGLPGTPATEDNPYGYSVTLTQPLLDIRPLPQLKRAKALVRAGRAQLMAVEEQVLLDAVRAYIDVLSDRAALKVREEDSDLLKKEVENAKTRFAVADVTRSDVSQAELRYAGSLASTSAARAKLAQSLASFQRTIGRAAEELEAEPAAPDVFASEEALLAQSLKSNPSLVRAREEDRAADQAVDVAGAQLLPRVSVDATYQDSRHEVANNIVDRGLSVLGRLQVPLYQGGGEYASIRQSKEEKDRTAFNIRDVETQVRQDVSSFWEARAAAQAMMSSTALQVKAGEEALKSVSEQALNGARTTYDVLNAAQDLLNARLSQVSAKHDFYLSSYQILQVSGRLTASALELPVTLYDPEKAYDSNAARWIGFGGSQE
jgi:TolC family type I secretion outer membrane protein